MKHLKIAHISDLHTKGLGKLELQLIDALNEVKPDIIVITGDLATPSGTLEGYKEVLQKLKARKGVFFVQGNWEYWEPIEGLKQTLKKSGVVDLTNQTHKIDEDLWLVGFDDNLAGNPQLDILKTVPTNVVKLGIFHSPTFFEKTTGLVELS